MLRAGCDVAMRPGPSMRVRTSKAGVCEHLWRVGMAVVASGTCADLQRGWPQAGLEGAAPELVPTQDSLLDHLKPS